MRSRSSLTTFSAGAAVVLFAVIALMPAMAPAHADADSLVYVAGGQVRVADADGVHARAVSPQGNWAWPSESDSGTIAALSTDGYTISEFDQQGNPLLSAPIVTPASTFNAAADYYVDHIRISPDGNRLAYNVVNCCGFSGKSTFTQPTTAGNSGWSDFTDDYINPVWVDASTANDPYVNSKDGLGLGSNGYNWSAEAAGTCCQYGIWNADNASDNGGWPSDSAIPSSDWEFEASYTRNLKHLALFLDDTGGARNVEIALESVDWSDQAATTDDCTIPLQAGSYSQIPQATDSISYSTDGSILAWADDTGIYEANVTDPSDCAAVKSSVHLVVSGGTYPYFGAAALGAAASGGSAAGGGGGSGSVSGGSGPAGSGSGSAVGGSGSVTSGSGSQGSGSGSTGSDSGSGGGPKKATQRAASPNTKLIKAMINHRTRTARFRFRGSGGSGKLTFKCRLDHRRWTTCGRSVTYRRMRRGKHTFSVRAMDRRGKLDRTPATKRFKV